MECGSHCNFWFFHCRREEGDDVDVDQDVARDDNNNNNESLESSSSSSQSGWIRPHIRQTLKTTLSFASNNNSALLLFVVGSYLIWLQQQQEEETWQKVLLSSAPSPTVIVASCQLPRDDGGQDKTVVDKVVGGPLQIGLDDPVLHLVDPSVVLFSSKSNQQVKWVDSFFSYSLSVRPLQHWRSRRQKDSFVTLCRSIFFWRAIPPPCFHYYHHWNKTRTILILSCVV